MVVWDLATKSEPPQRYCTIRFDAAVVGAFFHPLNRSVLSPIRATLFLTTLAISNIILAILATGEAYVVDRRPGQIAKADLRLPIAEEGVSHRYVMRDA